MHITIPIFQIRKRIWRGSDLSKGILSGIATLGEVILELLEHGVLERKQSGGGSAKNRSGKLGKDVNVQRPWPLLKDLTFILEISGSQI